MTCFPDPCADPLKNRCAPGTCTGRPNGEAYCVCPTGYTWDDSDPKSPACVLADACTGNPCGPPEAVLECRTDKVLEYTCVCRAGYIVGTVDGQKRCIPNDTTLKCADEPCGTQGLLSCTDTASGPVCQCDTKYRLVTDNRKTSCVFFPCEGDPCGDSVAVKSCSPGMSTYTCVCNSNYKLDTVDGLPMCVASTENYLLFFVCLGVLGAGALISLLSCYLLRRRMLARNAMEDYATQNLQVAMGAQQDGYAINASAWM